MLVDNEAYRALDGDYLFEKIKVKSPYGREFKREARVFYPSEEDLLEKELDGIEEALSLIHSEEYKRIKIIFHSFKEVRGSINTSKQEGMLTEVELFDIKSSVFLIKELIELLNSINSKFKLERLLSLEELLNPQGAHENSFYIYDSYSKRLMQARDQRSLKEKSLREAENNLIKEIEERYNVIVSRDKTIAVTKDKKELIRILEDANELEYSSENYRLLIFKIKEPSEIVDYRNAIDQLIKIEEEEEREVRKNLSLKIKESAKVFLNNLNKIGHMDYLIAKAEFADDYNLKRPNITNGNIIELNEGRYLKAEEGLRERGEIYTPISIILKDGATVITGANMGGKTLSIKLVGLCQWMTQLGMFVPCESYTTKLLEFIRTSIGDMQSASDGLSTFGAEIKHLIKIFEIKKKEGLLLIDELARGTNPTEGDALSVAIVDMLSKKTWITLVATHFEGVANIEGIRHYQVKGLKKEIKIEEGSNLSKYMDYRLELTDKDCEVPKDALRIAGILGLHQDIINQATEYLSIRKVKDGRTKT